MVKPIKLRASVGRQNVTSSTPYNQIDHIGNIRKQLQAITKNYENFLEELGAQSADVLYDALKPTFDLSQKYVPVDTQVLKESGFLEIDKTSKSPRVVIGYGRGGKPHYTVFVHEMVNMQHDAPTRSKFLLAALEEDENAIQQRIVNGYKRVLGK